MKIKSQVIKKSIREREEMGNYYLMDIKFQFSKMKKFLRPVAQ